MNTEEKEKLYAQIDSLLEIYNEISPLNKDGSFKIELVNLTINKMLDYIIDDENFKSNLKEWFEKKEFWTSPASTKYHGNTKGGLAAHSLAVIKIALDFSKSIFEKFEQTNYSEKYSITAEDIFIAALAHDFCKAGFYSTEFKKTKNFEGNWVYEPYYKTKSDNKNLGHGNESVLQLLEICPLLIKKRHIIEAISRHMGFSDLSDSESYNYSQFLRNPLVILIQLADQIAAQWFNY